MSLLDFNSWSWRCVRHWELNNAAKTNKHELNLLIIIRKRYSLLNVEGSDEVKKLLSLLMGGYLDEVKIFVSAYEDRTHCWELFKYSNSIVTTSLWEIGELVLTNVQCTNFIVLISVMDLGCFDAKWMSRRCSLLLYKDSFMTLTNFCPFQVHQHHRIRRSTFQKCQTPAFNVS